MRSLVEYVQLAEDCADEASQNSDALAQAGAGQIYAFLALLAAESERVQNSGGD